MAADPFSYIGRENFPTKKRNNSDIEKKTLPKREVNALLYKPPIHYDSTESV